MTTLGCFLSLVLNSSCGKEFTAPAPASGKDASPCTASRVDNVTTVYCPDGTEVEIPDGAPGVAGEVGQQGAAGTPGLNGSDGQNGQDATPVTVVQLCPGVTTYASVFVEVALCLNGSLYGVYSANGGFLTYLPPGAYNSNAIGSACSLVVGDNCEVSN